MTRKQGKERGEIKVSDKKPLKIDDVAKRYGICRSTAAEIFRSEDSPAYKIGVQWFIEEDEMIEYLKRKTEKEETT